MAYGDYYYGFRPYVSEAGSGLSKTRKGSGGAKVLAGDDLSEIFGIEIAPAVPSTRAAENKTPTKASTRVTAEHASRQTMVAGPAKLKKAAPRRSAGRASMKERKEP